MKHSVKRIYPVFSPEDLFGSYSLLFLSEGFLQNDKKFFFKTCNEFILRLIKRFPFSASKIDSFFNTQFYAKFDSSKHSGSAIEKGSTKGRTVFESYLKKEDGIIEIAPSVVVEYLKNINFYAEERSVFNLILETPNLSSQMLIVLLVSNNEGQEIAGESLFRLKEANNVLCVVTSMTGYWEQVILRGLCELMQLGNEYEIDHPDYRTPHPNSNIANLQYSNLVYLEEARHSIKLGALKWRRLSGIHLHDKEIIVNKHPLHPNKADNTIPQFNYSSEEITLWEGGGGYLTRVYRSAYDCIMRRKIGDINLPLRYDELSLCKACESYLLKMIFSKTGFRTGIIRSE